jgi:hypothetical protein
VVLWASFTPPTTHFLFSYSQHAEVLTTHGIYRMFDYSKALKVIDLREINSIDIVESGARYLDKEGRMRTFGAHDSHYSFTFIHGPRYVDDEFQPIYKEAAHVVVKRFPYDYVLEHRFELGQQAYSSVCDLLAREKGFNIDKSRLKRFEYLQILANNHIHIDDEEADSLLFDHIMIWLCEMQRKVNEEESVDWSKYSRVTPWSKYRRVTPRYTDYLDRQSKLLYWFSYKPSLYEVPWVGRYAMNLCFTGNTNTVAKLIVWNQFLRSNLQSYSEENEEGTIKLERVVEELDDNIDRNWRRFIELAIGSCPVEKATTEGWFMSDEDDELKLE